MNPNERRDRLERRVARLNAAVIGLGLLWVVTLVWAAYRSPVPPVLAVERLEIREPDGSLAFALASSAHPTPATMDGEVLLADQIEARRHPSFIYFDGRGDEVGGLMLVTRDGSAGTSVARFLTFDGHDHQETVVLGHTQGPQGTVSGLRVIGHTPGATLVGALAELGLEPGATRAELQEAIATIPEEQRASTLRRLAGATRVEVGSAINGSAGVTLRDREGRPRVILEAPATGAPSLRFLDENGDIVLTLPGS
jgi:hypothetical protein